MPGFVHDGVVELLERHPEILLELWARAGGPRLPSGLAIDRLPNELRITFGSAQVRHLRPDLLLRLHTAPPLPLLSETQTVRDPTRPIAWEVHLLLARQLFGCMPAQTVCALGYEVERWVRRRLSERPGLRHMCVIGPDQVARIDTLREARQRPLHAALGVAFHRRNQPLRMAQVTLRALLERLPEPEMIDYVRMVLAAVPPEDMKELRTIMDEHRLVITRVEREGYLYNKAFTSGQRSGSRRGRKKGLEEGRKEGRKEGLEEAHAQLVALIVELLATRGLEAPAMLLESLRACSDFETLRRVALHAATIADPSELIGELLSSNERRAARSRTRRAASKRAPRRKA